MLYPVIHFVNWRPLAIMHLKRKEFEEKAKIW